MGITVAQALEIDVLRQSEVRAGRTGLQRTVEQVLVLDDAPPSPDDQALYLTSLASIQHNAQAQCSHIATLAEYGSAGMVYQPARAFQLFPEALALADRLTFPVIELPAGVHYTEIITSVMTALMREQTAAIERQRMFQQQLIDLLLRGFGLDHLVRATAERLRRPVLVLSARDDTRAFYGLDEAQLQQWHALIARQPPVRPRILDLHRHHAPPLQLSVVPLPGTQRPGWIATTYDTAFGAEHKAIIEQAGAILALDLIKHATVAAAQRNRQVEVLDALLDGRYDSEEQVLREADQIGCDLRRCRAVVLVRGGTTRASQNRSIADAVRQVSPTSIIHQRGDDVLLLPKLATVAPAVRSELRDLAHALHQALHESSYRQCVVAVGSQVESPLGLCASYRDALGALRLGAQLPATSGIVHYEDAQLLVMLSDFAERSEVQKWLRAQIGVLIDYDQRNKTTLVQTLEVALDQGGVLTVTAEQLSIHPNTLKYRLQRIEEILDLNPLSGPHRLAYHIAAKLARLVV